MTEVKNVTIEDIINKQVEKHGENTDIELIKRAYNLANEKHGNQFRMSGEPYIVHPLAVAYILVDLVCSTFA